MGMRLVTVDLDGTLLPGTTAFSVVLRAAGRGADVEASDRRYLAGTTSIAEAFAEQWPWVQELSLQELHRHLRRYTGWLSGIGAGVARLRAAGLDVRLLTDQPSSITDFVGRWGLAPAIASPVAVREGRQVGIDVRLDKLANLRAFCDAHGVPLGDVCHVGNGINDVPVFAAVGRSIAVFAPPEVAATADVDLGAVDGFGVVVDAVLGHGK